MPNELPPAYEEVANSSKTYKVRNGIPPERRRSMEDENRPLPSGWVRQFDAQSQHQFFVDTTAKPPRSIWHHPYDDETYLSTLPSEERQRVEGIHGIHRTPSHRDIAAESSADDEHFYPQTTGGQSKQQQPKGLSKFGRRMKDKMTGTTHQEREQERQQRAQEEQQAYERHQMYRDAMSRAAETGQPQLIGKDKTGKDVYICPPEGYDRGYGGGGGYPGAGGGQYIHPFQSGAYGSSNARYIRPQDPYYRPYGYGYGGGLGMPLMLGMGGGMMGGALLGGGLMGGGMMF